eukprot:SAG31_NODE_44_length_31168_cov_16.507290_15_plen_240_part_00
MDWTGPGGRGFGWGGGGGPAGMAVQPASHSKVKISTAMLPPQVAERLPLHGTAQAEAGRAWPQCVLGDDTLAQKQLSPFSTPATPAQPSWLHRQAHPCRDTAPLKRPPAKYGRQRSHSPPAAVQAFGPCSSRRQVDGPSRQVLSPASGAASSSQRSSSTSAIIDCLASIAPSGAPAPRARGAAIAAGAYYSIYGARAARARRAVEFDTILLVISHINIFKNMLLGRAGPAAPARARAGD